MPTKLLLTADCHLRTSQYARSSRGEDFSAALLNVFQVAVREKISTICISGDLLDSTRPSPRIIATLKELDASACRHGILILVTSGNHDLTDPHWATIAGVATSGPCGLRIIDNELVTLACGLKIYGQPFINKEKFMALRRQIPKADVLMFHAMVQELTHGFKSENAFALADLPTEKYQVIALGDVHHREYVRVGSCLVGQPGSTELCESGEDENKTVTVLTFDDHNRLVGEPEFLPIKTRQVLRFKLTTEEEVEQALLTAETQKKNCPIVIVEFAVHLTNVPQRFASRLDPTQVILRFMPIFQGLNGMNLGADVRENLPLTAFLAKMIPPGTPLYELAETLLSPEVNTVETLERYIENRRAELVAAT
jgi:DNA repair exonuclease SbcCD nuclease subunit